MRAACLIVLGAAAAFAGVDAKLVGVWSANGTTIKIEANGRCSVGREVGKCQTLLRALFYQPPNGQVITYGWSVKGDELTISGNGLNQVFKRGTDEPSPPPAPAPVTGTADPAPPAPPALPPGAAAGRWSHPTWGLDFALPAGWKAAERDGLVLLGSDTEAGLIVVRFMPKTDRQMLVAGYREGLQESGVSLMPTKAIEELAGGGLAGELGGTGQDGARLTARVIGMPTPFGDAAVFLGLTTAEKYAGLKPRVDALAASASFTQPKIPPANVAIAARYSYIYVSSSGGSYSRQDNVSLCSNGTFYRSGEMAGSGSAGSAVTSRQNGGRWTADGDGQNGTVTLQYGNGSVERLRYQKSGLDIVLNGRKYGRLGDGNCR
jgi:hypothetical protein